MKSTIQEKQLKRGFINGIGLTLAVAMLVFFGVRLTNAQANTQGTNVIWTDPSDSANASASGSTSNDTWSDTTNPNDSTASMVTSTPVVNSTPAITSSDNTVSTAQTSYVTLGDSVAAGLGLPLLANATASDKQCGRSAQAYPQIVAAQLNRTVTSFACSGATAGDLVTKQGVSGPNIAPQLTQAYANGKPDLITITAGANDIKWAQVIQKCYVTTCGTKLDTTAANASFVVLQAKLYYLFYDLQTRQVRAGDSPPTVVVTGYYNPLSIQCTSIEPKLTANEVIWVQGAVAALNQTIKDVASQFSFVHFAPVDFNGHDVCSADSWVQGPTDLAPIHPTAAGQAAIARSVVNTIQTIAQ